MQIAHFDEGYNILVRNDRRLKYFAVAAKEFRATTTITDQQLAVHQFVARNLIEYSEADPVRVRTVRAQRTIESTLTCRPKPSSRLSFSCRRLTPSRNVLGVRLGSDQSPQTLVSRVTHQRL